MRSVWFLLLFLVMSLFAAGAQADFDLRCGGRLVILGETKPEVLSSCGEPTFIDTPRSALVDIGGVLWPIEVDEEWIYNLGPQQFIRYVQFRDGRVVNIEHGGYGWTGSNGHAN